MSETKSKGFTSLFDANMEEFGRFEPLVRKWANKHNMGYVMEEFIDLFQWIEAQAKLDEREEIQRQLLLKGIDVNIVFQSTVTKPLEQRGKNDKNS